MGILTQSISVSDLKTLSGVCGLTTETRLCTTGKRSISTATLRLFPRNELTQKLADVYQHDMAQKGLYQQD